MRAVQTFFVVMWIGMMTMAIGTSAEAAENWLERLFDPATFDQSPSQLAWRPGSQQLAYWWDDGQGVALWLEEAGNGKKEKALTLSQLGAKSLGELDEMVWHSSGQQAVFNLGGRLLHWQVQKNHVRTLKTGEGTSDPKFSPDGRNLAYVRDVELYLYDLEKGVETRLTHDGQTDVIFNGVTDWVYWEEIWGRDSTGFWWHPDGNQIAYYHIDDSEVPVYTLVDTRPLYPSLELQRYPKAGDVLPRVEIRVLDLKTGEHVRLATGEDPDVYLTRVYWHPNGEQLAVERLNRDQTQLDLLLCASDGSSCQTWLSEKWPTWVNLGDEFLFLPDGGFLWSAERENWRHLYRYDAQGQLLGQLTPEGWNLTTVHAVNPEEGWFVFSAFSTATLGASERHIFKGFLSGDSAERLTHGQGWNQALVSPSGAWIRTWSDANTPPHQAFRQLGVNDERPMVSKKGTLDPKGLAQWEFLTVPGPGGSELPAQILKPIDFDSTRSYPVLMYHYGGPGSQVVENRWRSVRKRYLWHKLMAERGYISFAVDNQASRFFGKKGQDKLHRRFGEVELAGQLAGVKFLQQQPWVDPARLGLWGWSGGGSNTLYSLFRKPGVWKAGVSGAPVTDWRYYDAIWMERYLDHPADNPKGYENSAPITYAADLRDPLLLIHGTADNNVHPQNSYNLVQRLVEAGILFDFALYPNARHSLQTFKESGQRHLFAKMTDFFDRHLRTEKSDGERSR